MRVTPWQVVKLAPGGGGSAGIAQIGRQRRWLRRKGNHGSLVENQIKHSYLVAIWIGIGGGPFTPRNTWAT